MITDLINEAAKKYYLVKQQVLAKSNLICKCKDPGRKIECKDCPYFVKIVKQIQDELYPDDYKHGTQFDCGYRYDSKVSRGKHSEEIKEECINLYQKLGSIREVVEIMGINNSTIRRWILQAGLEIKIPLKRYTLEEKLKAVKLYQESGSYREVGRQMECPFGTIKLWVKKFEEGTLKEDYRSPKEEKVEEAIKLYQEGMSRIKVCEKIGVNKTTFNTWLLENKIPLRPSDSSTVNYKYDEETRQRCLNIYDQTKSYQATSIETGVHPETVKLWVKKRQKQNISGDNI